MLHKMSHTSCIPRAAAVVEDMKGNKMNDKKSDAPPIPNCDPKQHINKLTVFAICIVFAPDLVDTHEKMFVL